mgnify:CR=1 FL=1
MSIIEETLLFESRMSDAKKKFGTLNMYDWQFLDSLDPSDNHKYLMWLATTYDKEGVVDDDRVGGKFEKDVKQVLSHFHRYPEKYEERDINQYKSTKDLYKAFHQAQLKISKKEQKRSGSRKVYEDDSYLVIVPTTHEASCFYGAGTKWCTSADKPGHFTNYSRKGVLMYLLNKELPETDPLYKVALYKAYSGGKETYYDATDQVISDIKTALTPELERTIDVTYNVMKETWLEARKGHNFGDPRIEALINSLGLDEEQAEEVIDEEYEHYGLPVFHYGDEEYAVATDAEADEAHYEYVENLIDDIGFEGFNHNIDWYINGDDVATDWEDSVTEWVYDDPGSYLDEDDKQYFDQDIFDNLAEKQEQLTEYEERVKELYDKDSASWVRDEKEIEQLEGEAEDLELEITDLESDLEDSRDWSDEQKDDYVESYLDDIREDPVNYLKDMGYGNDELERYVDREAFIQGVVDEGYRGENLSSYDGEENEEDVNGTWYYIYRIN